jgi:hypothetical protein
LELLDEVFVGVLGHAAALVGVKEYVVNVKGGSDKTLGVCVRYFGTSAIHSTHSPEAFVKRADVKVNFYFVVLEGDKRKSKSRVSAVPELEGHIKSGFWECVARSAHLSRCRTVTRTIYISEVRVSYICESGGVANHFVVSFGLVLVKGELIPDVHPVTVLAVDALATNFNFYLLYKLLTREIKPSGIYVTRSIGKFLSNFWEGYLKVCAVSKVTISAYSACYTAAEISLAIESLFDRFHREVSVTSVGNFPESNLRITS